MKPHVYQKVKKPNNTTRYWIDHGGFDSYIDLNAYGEFVGGHFKKGTSPFADQLQAVLKYEITNNLQVKA